MIPVRPDLGTIPRKHRRYPWARTNPRRLPVTVAIAAICRDSLGQMIVAIEDQMVTAGDINYEQAQPKIWKATNSCILMIYGSLEAQTEIAHATCKECTVHSLTAIAEIAEVYGRLLRSYIRRRAEVAVLQPIGLTSALFLKRQAGMNDRVVETLTEDMQLHYDRSGLRNELGGAIVAGTETGGAAHIYRVEHGEVDFMTSVGFVAAGSGQWHAESQFMFSEFTSYWTLPDTIALVHRAKRRAEVAPGVGLRSDLAIVTSAPPSVYHFKDDSPIIAKLRELYAEADNKQKQALREESAAVGSFWDSLFPRPASPKIEAPATLEAPTHDPSSPPPSQE